ncbi:uncharacterized protein LOC134206456 [Armigeres subalbatus]|uniref:uncharacterized protein LOC134206456 n=1 Tax=Armigeres subalbatus TaxID=124917 RepID=UPI002ED5A19E
MKWESFDALNTVLMTFKVNLQQLEKLGENTENWITILAFMLSQKLDTATLRQWETHHSSKNIPQCDAMTDFLEKHCAILHSTSLKLSDSGPILRNTELGWIVAGEIPDSLVITLSAVTASVSTEEIHEQLARFWNLESCRTKSCLSVEESTCELIFEQTTTRDADGKFRVVLLKKQFMMKHLGKSKEIATKRCMALESRLTAYPEMKALYTKFIHGYSMMGHMREVRKEEEELINSYYLPHHAVIKPDSTTTNLRVVFDASCATDSGVSLNDTLMVGPVVQDDSLLILLHSRLQKYAIVNDIEKMYRMINVVEQDRPLQRILRRESVDQPIRTYQLSTVTYGTSLAPYLATQSLKKCVDEGEQAYPAAAQVVKRNFYVDDMLTGAKSVKEGQSLCSDVSSLLSSAGFNLRKWHSNQPAILKGEDPWTILGASYG